MRSTLRYLWVFSAVAVVFAAGGCNVTKMMTVTAVATKMPADEDSAAFLDRISSQANVSENDAMRGFLLLLDGRDSAKSFDERVESLRARKIVDARWSFDATRAITRGKLAYMAFQACKMSGGIMIMLAGPTQRYCLREMQYRRMMTAGSMCTPVTGMEFVGVLSRADAFIRRGKTPGGPGTTDSLEEDSCLRRL